MPLATLARGAFRGVRRLSSSQRGAMFAKKVRSAASQVKRSKLGTSIWRSSFKVGRAAGTGVMRTAQKIGYKSMGGTARFAVASKMYKAGQKMYRNPHRTTAGLGAGVVGGGYLANRRRKSNRVRRAY